MVLRKKFNSQIRFITTFFFKPLKRYAITYSEQVFLISFGLLATCGYVILFWLLGFIWNAHKANWKSLVNTAIELAKDIFSWQTLVPLVVSTLILFFMINLIRSSWQLFKAFWDSLEVE